MNEREAIEKLLRERPDLAPTIKGWLDSRHAVDLSKEELVIVASPDHCDIDGSKQARCACGTLVWLSPDTQEVITRRDAAPMRIICAQCFIDMPKDNL